MLNNSDQLQFIISSIIVATVGGIANWLMSDNHSIFQFVVAIFLAAFTGFLVSQLCIEYNVSEPTGLFFAGASGLCAELILKMSRKTVISKMSLFTEQKIDDELEDYDKEYKQMKEKEECSKLDKFLK